MLGLIAKLRKRRQDRFFATFPPVFRDQPDFPQWVLDKFKECRGRDFNPYDHCDRHDIELALNRAMIRALPVLFGREVSQ